MGDGAMVEFGSVVDAVATAVELQKDVAVRQTEVPHERRIVFRIGINLGDVVVEGDDLFGDAVNVAARLEQLCEPGGVAVSGTAYDHLQGRLNLPLEYTGEQRVKNISRPVRVYRVAPTGVLRSRRRWSQRTVPLALVLVLVLAIGALGAKWWYDRERNPALSAEPSIAVLPFDNMSGDPSQDYFGDGLAEDIITELARNRDLLVIARNSTFQFKAKAADLREVGQHLGAAYVLDGSARLDEGRLRVTAQLVETAGGTHVWAERWDRPVIDLFAVQDEITTAIAGTLLPHLRAAEERRIRAKPPASLVAYDLTRQCIEAKHIFTRESSLRARDLCRRATEIDPKYALAWTYWGYALVMDFWGNLTGTATLATIDEALEYLRRAVGLDPTHPFTYQGLSQAYMAKGQWDDMLAAGRKAVELGPSDAENLILLADAFGVYGKYDEGVAAAWRAFRHNPLAPPYYVGIVSYQLYMTGAYERLLELTRPCADLDPGNMYCVPFMSLALLHLGKAEEARANLPRLQEKFPGMSYDYFVNTLLHTRDPELQRRVREDFHTLNVGGI
jgi:TolB-like protein